MKACLAALAATVVIFLAAQLVVDGLRAELSAATAGSVPAAVRLDAGELPPLTGELSPKPPPVIPPLARRGTRQPPPSVRLDPQELAVRGPVMEPAARE